ncbi:hypothetical protein [Arenibacterium halophilum]|uniref:hypothetical protein n=1 Tax=Arenibacterium halophilum TaxID=2583821 RepID=UPI001AED4856|nr:hypothetical protein [Arenibacterium halophilum]
MLDYVQTWSPYIYLLPPIALLGFGPATAVVAIVIFAVTPVIRLVAHGNSSKPFEFVEVGGATRTAPRDAFLKIRPLFALPSIVAGVNRSLRTAFGIVVITGIHP